jgi:hypothetical protein
VAIALYSELKTALANWTKRDDLTSRIPEFIAMAEDKIGFELRVRAMETSADIAITASTQTAALPTRFLQQQRLYMSATRKDLTFVARDDFWTRQAVNESGQPTIYTIEGENFVFAPVPDAAYTAKCLYYQKFAALSADSDTNWILTNARGLYLYGALIQAAPYLEDDPRAITWAAFYQDILDSAHRADKRDRFPNALQQRTTVTTP